LFSTTIYLSGGIIGTFHHLYFTGMPNFALIGFEAWENIRLSQGTAQTARG
jgi:nitric oxide reductase subunit B